MFRLIDSGWNVLDYSSLAATVDVGVAVGGGHFSLCIKDSQNRQRKLNYGGGSLGGGIGVHSDGAGRAILNFILPLFRGAVNSLSLPSTTSRIFLIERLSQPQPLNWEGDFVRRYMNIATVGAGMGMGVSGTMFIFEPSVTAAATPIVNARAVAFAAGMQVGQIGGDCVATVTHNYS